MDATSEKAYRLAVAEAGPAILATARKFRHTETGEVLSAVKPTTPAADGPIWPREIEGAAFYGLAGEIVRAIEPHTEADPVALLAQILDSFGNCLGRCAFYAVEGDRHYSNEYIVLVGDTSKARKGTSWGRIRKFFESLDQDWASKRVHSGLSSGEGLIWAVRDPIYGRERTGKGSDARTVEVEQDAGVADKRLFIIESEFANVLRVMTREGNTLSRVIRDGWDRGDLASMTKNNPARASGAHVSITGHITADELRRYLDATESANGFANRFIFLCVRRSKFLPHGGNLGANVLAMFTGRLSAALENAKVVGELKMDAQADAAWIKVYNSLSEGQPGLLGAILGRAEAHVVRLALIYALLDGSSVIGLPHLKAALALWDYAEASARYIFGAMLGDPIADEIARGLRSAGEYGLSRTEISRLFKNNRSSSQIGRALELLRLHRRAHSTKVETEGRSVEQWLPGDAP